MKKLLNRIVLLLSILLLGGQGTAFAGNGKPVGNILTLNALSAQHEIALNNALALDTANYKCTLAPHQKQVEKVDPTDSEEEEESHTASKKISIKKTTELATNYFSVAFSVPTPEYQYNSIKKRSDNYPCFSYSISNRWYILFRVIRI